MKFGTDIGNRPTWRLHLLLLCFSAIAAVGIWLYPDKPLGDWPEYYLTAQAIASHGSPDIRVEDTVALGKLFAPGRYEADVVKAVNQDLTASLALPRHGFVKSSDGPVYAMHYFGYSALASAVHVLTGVPIAKALLAVNAVFILILVLAAYRLFGTVKAAAAAVALFMLSGGFHYSYWSSPEVMSAAGLLSALIFMHCGAVGMAAILLGLAAMQNPTIVFAFAIVPVYYLVTQRIGWVQSLPWSTAWREPRTLLAIGLGGLLALLPIAFNLWTFGTPNIIAKLASDPELIGLPRLHSFFFDLNQGMVPNVLGLFVCLALLLAWRRRYIGVVDYKTSLPKYLLLATILSLAMAIPTLAAPNWNSGAFGMLRYAFWAAMPFLFALLVGLAERPSLWNRTFVVFVVVQGLTISLGYPVSHLNNTKLVNWIYNHAPWAYNPDPEIFVERLLNVEKTLDPQQVYVFKFKEQPRKFIFQPGNPGIDLAVCGDHALIPDDIRPVAAGKGWFYLNAPVACVPDGKQVLLLDVDDFRSDNNKLLVSGWSTPEGTDPIFPGVWSIGDRSVLKLQFPSPRTVSKVIFSGHYYGINQNTQVRINGVDFGLLPLGPQKYVLPIQGRLGWPVEDLMIELMHQTPQSPRSNGQEDPRMLAYYLRSLAVQHHEVKK